MFCKRKVEHAPLFVQLTPLNFGSSLYPFACQGLKTSNILKYPEVGIVLTCLTGNCVSSIGTGGRVFGLLWVFPVKFDIRSEFN